MLLLTSVNRVNLIRTNAIKAFSVFIYSLAALLIFALEGKVDWIVGLWMVLGSIIGAWFSSIWSVRKGGERAIRITLLIMVSYQKGFVHTKQNIALTKNRGMDLLDENRTYAF